MLAALVVAAILAVPAVAHALPAPDIVGRVVADGTGDPIADTWVYVYDEYWNWRGDASTDANGDYSFSGLGDGTYNLWFGGGWSGGRYFDGEWSPGWATVDASTRPVSVDASLAERIPLIAGTVTDGSTGTPLQDVEVDAYQSDGAGSYYLYTWDYSGSDGKYGFLWLPEGTYTLLFNDFQFGLSEWWDDAATIDDATPIVAAYGATQIANAQIDRPAPSLAGRITDESTGMPVDSGYVYIYRSLGGGNGTTSTARTPPLTVVGRSTVFPPTCTTW